MTNLPLNGTSTFFAQEENRNDKCRGAMKLVLDEICPTKSDFVPTVARVSNAKLMTFHVAEMH